MSFACTNSFARTLRTLSGLLAYPDAALRACLPQMRAVLDEERALGQRRRAELDTLMQALERTDPLQAESDYVELFDRGRATSLHLFEHVHGDSRERGPAMIDLARTYEQAGMYLEPGELPDYLPAVLEFASMLPEREARAFLGETAHILNALFNALQARASAYAGVLGAALDLAGEHARPVALPAEPSLDESWSEPPVFGACASGHDAVAGTAQPVRVYRRTTTTGAST